MKKDLLDTKTCGSHTVRRNTKGLSVEHARVYKQCKTNALKEHTYEYKAPKTYVASNLASAAWQPGTSQL